MVYKKAALAILLLNGVEGIKISERSIAKHDFIKRMRAAQKAKGRSTRRMNWTKLTEKSIHKPGLRSNTKRVSPNGGSKMDPTSKTTEEKQAGRQLWWWNDEPGQEEHWWNSNNGPEEHWWSRNNDPDGHWWSRNNGPEQERTSWWSGNDEEAAAGQGNNWWSGGNEEAAAEQENNGYGEQQQKNWYGANYAPEQQQKSWWQFWKNDVTEDELEELWDAMNETNFTEDEDRNKKGNWWTWNWNFTDDNDDMWIRDGEENVTYIINGLSSLSMKYAGCSSLKSFIGVEEGEDDQSYPFVTNNFVSYRLCPSETCHDNSWSGCKQVYGEYMMSIEDFLQAQQSYVDEEFEAFCTYCENCMYFDKWFSGWNYTAYNETIHGCDLYDECVDYEQICTEEYEQEQADEREHAYEDFLGCTEVDIDLSYYGYGNDDDKVSEVQQYVQNSYGYNMDAENEVQKAYIGPHCDDGVIGIGLFADEDCTHYVGNKFDVFNVTGFEMEAEVIDEVYVPEGCHSCAGDSLKNSKWYVPDEDQAEEYMEYANQVQTQQYQDTEEDEQDYKVCYNMYISSAKCQSHFTDEYSIPLQLSESEIKYEDTYCNFMDDVIKGHIDDEGLVWSHQGPVNPLVKFFSLAADDMEKDMTDAQLAALVFGGIATSGLAALAFQMKAKLAALDGSMNQGLL